MRLKYTIESRSLSGGERQGGLWDATGSILGEKINLSTLRQLRSEKKVKRSGLFLQFKHLVPSITLLHLFHLSLSGPSSLCQSWHSERNKTAYHDDKGDRSYKTPYEMIVHTQPAPVTKICTLSSAAEHITKTIFIKIWTLKIHINMNINTVLQKREGTPKVPLLMAGFLSEMWPLIRVKGFFYTVLLSLRGHLQTRGHRRVFKQKGFNVVAHPRPRPETTVVSPSATFKWHEKLNSCPILEKWAQMDVWFFFRCGVQRIMWGAWLKLRV